MTDTQVKAEAVLDALREVEDPEIPINLVDLGLIYDVTVDGRHVSVEFTLTSMGCPADDMIRDSIERRVLEMDGVEEVSTELTWEPAWTSDDITEQGREKLQEFGISA